MADYTATLAETSSAEDSPGGVAAFGGVLYDIVYGDGQFIVAAVLSRLAESVAASDAYSTSPLAIHLTVVEGIRTVG